MQLWHVRLTVSLALAFAVATGVAAAQDATGESQATFRTGVDLVSVATVVRDGKGRVVRTLESEDFVVTEGGHPRAIVDFRSDDGGPASLALLVDGSGSMRLDDALVLSRWICHTILGRLSAAGDAAALMSFDTRLLTLRGFTSELDAIREDLPDLEAYGATSIYDAIAGTADAVSRHTRQRRAVVVLTDGSDNASRYSAAEVAQIASTIDVPVYVFAVGDEGADRDEGEDHDSPGPLEELARATGGSYFPAAAPAIAYRGINQLLEELRHQYLLAFEPSSGSGLRRIEVQARNRRLRVSARSWYAPGD